MNNSSSCTFGRNRIVDMPLKVEKSTTVQGISDLYLIINKKNGLLHT